MRRAVIVAALLSLSPQVLAAQQLRLKREPPAIAWPGCPAASKPAAVPEPERQEAERLATAATEASILGDHTSALDLLTRAAARDPSSDRVAYRLARTLEMLDRHAAAVAEYCRYLALAPDAADAPEARGRLAALTEQGGAVPAAAAAAFAAAIAHYDAGRLAEAEAALSTALDAAPDWGDALYDRGVVRLALREMDGAADDLRRYVELNPGSRDFANVLRALGSVPNATMRYSPTAAFTTGLLLPGLGHFTTGRPVSGLLVLGAAAAAVSAGVLLQRVNVDCLSPPVGGRCPPEQVLRETRQRPYLAPALGAAAAVGVLGAIDAFRGAKQQNERAAGLLRIGGEGAAAVLVPDVELHAAGASVSLVRLSF